MRDKTLLVERGRDRIQEFCKQNNLPCPPLTVVPVPRWRVNACAYYRPSTIHICLERCAFPATELQLRNWNWPGTPCDREPFGVVCHELGHHCDRLQSKSKGAYFGDFSSKLRKKSGEEKLTSYCPNSGEWFAEMMRLFLTNPSLLKILRPKTYTLLKEVWTPVGDLDWRKELRKEVPSRILRNVQKKISLLS